MAILADAQPVWSTQFGRGSGPIVFNNVDCDPNEAALLECNVDARITFDCLRHTKDAGVRCQIDPRLKNISARVTSAGNVSVHTVLIRWELQNNMLPHHFEAECFNEQHKIAISVSNTTFNMQFQGLLSATSYTCCVLAFYREDDRFISKRICTTVETPVGSIQTQNGCTSNSTPGPDKTSAPDNNSINFSASGSANNNIVFGVLGFIIGILLILLALCGVALVYLLRRQNVTSKE